MAHSGGKDTDSSDSKVFLLLHTMDRGDWWAPVHRVTKSWTRLNVHWCTHTHTYSSYILIYPVIGSGFFFSFSLLLLLLTLLLLSPFRLLGTFFLIVNHTFYLFDLFLPLIWLSAVLWIFLLLFFVLFCFVVLLCFFFNMSKYF